MKNALFLLFGCWLLVGCATGVKSRDIYAKGGNAPALRRSLERTVDSLTLNLQYRTSTKGEHLFKLIIENNRNEDVYFSADSCWIVPFALSKSAKRQSMGAQVALNADEFVDQMERRYQKDQTKAKVGGGLLIAGVVITSIALMGNSGLDASNWLVSGADVVDLSIGSAVILNEAMQGESERLSATGTEGEIKAAEGLLFDHAIPAGTTLEGPVALPRIKAKWFVVTIWMGGSEFSFPFEEI